MELFWDIYQFIGHLKSKTVVFSERRKRPLSPIRFPFETKSLYISIPAFFSFGPVALIYLGRVLYLI